MKKKIPNTSYCTCSLNKIQHSIPNGGVVPIHERHSNIRYGCGSTNNP